MNIIIIGQIEFSVRVNIYMCFVLGSHFLYIHSVHISNVLTMYFFYFCVIDKRMDAVTVLQDKFKEILGDSINFKMYNDTPKSNVNIKDERSLENDISSSLIHRHSLMNV